MSLEETSELIQNEFAANGGGMTITIAGAKHTGMTIIASFIEKALKEAGFDSVVVHDDETNSAIREDIVKSTTPSYVNKVNDLNKNSFAIRMVPLDKIPS